MATFGGRWDPRVLEWARAVARGRDAGKAGADEEMQRAVFREHFVGDDEGKTEDASKVEVAALLGNLRLELLRGDDPKGQEGGGK